MLHVPKTERERENYKLLTFVGNPCIDMDYGEISNPGYPGYNSNANECYTITGEPGVRVGN